MKSWWNTAGHAFVFLRLNLESSQCWNYFKFHAMKLILKQFFFENQEWNLFFFNFGNLCTASEMKPKWSRHHINVSRVTNSSSSFWISKLCITFSHNTFSALFTQHHCVITITTRQMETPDHEMADSLTARATLETPARPCMQQLVRMKNNAGGLDFDARSSNRYSQSCTISSIEY